MGRRRHSTNKVASTVGKLLTQVEHEPTMPADMNGEMVGTAVIHSPRTAAYGEQSQRLMAAAPELSIALHEMLSGRPSVGMHGCPRNPSVSSHVVAGIMFRGTVGRSKTPLSFMSCLGLSREQVEQDTSVMLSSRGWCADSHIHNGDGAALIDAPVETSHGKQRKINAVVSGLFVSSLNLISEPEF